MAERRMFAKTIIDSDAFLEMPMSARLLYYDLGMRADDDGFINSPKKIMRTVGASDDDMRILILRKFIIPLDKGIVVIKHWRIHNYIRNDRYKPTVYIEQKKKLELNSNNGYSLKNTNGIPTVYQMETQDRLGKVSIGKVNNSTTTTNTHACIQDNELIDDHEEELPVEELQTSDIYSYLERAWGRTLSPYEYTLLENWTNDEITRYAIKESVKCNARSIKYVETIVKALKAKGIKTEAEAIKESDNFKARKQKNCNNKVDDVFERYANSGGTDE